MFLCRLYVKKLTPEEKCKQDYFLHRYHHRSSTPRAGVLGGELELTDLYTSEDADIREQSQSPTCREKPSPEAAILDELTPCDVRVLVHSEEELTQTDTFERIFPTID